MNLLALVVETLRERNVTHALIGGAALAAYGVARGTLDADILVLADEALDESMWKAVEAAGARVDIRRGAADDPFRAVIRISASGASPVDVLVGRFAWQRDVLARARPRRLPMVNIPVVEAADLVLLKIYAGGPQDLADAQRLLASPEREQIVADVESRLDRLPAECDDTWQRIKPTGE